MNDGSHYRRRINMPVAGLPAQTGGSVPRLDRHIGATNARLALTANVLNASARDHTLQRVDRVPAEHFRFL
jgi:hypothetical protein